MKQPDFYYLFWEIISLQIPKLGYKDLLKTNGQSIKGRGLTSDGQCAHTWLKALSIALDVSGSACPYCSHQEKKVVTGLIM